MSGVIHSPSTVLEHAQTIVDKSGRTPVATGRNGSQRESEPIGTVLGSGAAGSATARASGVLPPLTEEELWDAYRGLRPEADR